MTNTSNLRIALNFMRTMLHGQLGLHFGKEIEFHIESPSIVNDNSPFAEFINSHQPTFEEYITLILALTGHISPGFIGNIIAEYLPNGGELAEFGGIKGSNHRSILPTGETAQFILAGDDMEKRMEVQQLFSVEHWLYKKNILQLETVPHGEPMMSGRIILDPEVVELLTNGSISRPRFSAEFPAEYITTEMNWEDLVLYPNTLQQIREIEDWIRYNDTLMHEWNMQKKLKQGYRALFYGPPGTGKTLTATLLGKYTGKDVFRIDLSRVVSKYIGETEKNLSRLFHKAENKNWILFFDEADALFGKRTDIRDAQDKYANQEVAYLLQRIENYNGLVILATNQRANVDEAFSRRFQAIIHFPVPRQEERCMMWEKAFPSQLTIAEEVNWSTLAAKYELTGAGIMNVAHYCAISALSDQSLLVDNGRIEAAVLREYIKEGKIV